MQQLVVAHQVAADVEFEGLVAVAAAAVEVEVGQRRWEMRRPVIALQVRWKMQWLVTALQVAVVVELEFEVEGQGLVAAAVVAVDVEVELEVGDLFEVGVDVLALVAVPQLLL